MFFMFTVWTTSSGTVLGNRDTWGANHMAELTRRAFATAGAAGLGLLLCTPTANALDRALRLTATRSVSTTGTTLEQVATGGGTGSYSRLSAGPGWPLVVRSDLATPQTGRDDRRRALSAFVQFT